MKKVYRIEQLIEISRELKLNLFINFVKDSLDWRHCILYKERGKHEWIIIYTGTYITVASNTDKDLYGWGNWVKDNKWNIYKYWWNIFCDAYRDEGNDVFFDFDIIEVLDSTKYNKYKWSFTYVSY